MLSTHADVCLSDPAFVMEALRQHLAEHDVAVTCGQGEVRAVLGGAEATMRAERSKLVLQARAPSRSQLEEATAFFAAHVREFAHPAVPDIHWAGMEERQLFADFRELSVLSTTDLTPHMRRVTLVGEDLERFATNENLHVRLYFPKPGTEPQWPLRGADGLSQPVDPDRSPDMRKYTIRRIDLAAGQVDIDFVLHADAGPGSAWAERAKAGDRLGMAGPGGRGVKKADWYLLAGDETALPAIARVLEGLPTDASGRVIIEVESKDDKIELEHPGGMTIEWLHRSETGSSLDAAVCAVEVPRYGSRFCWAGAEFETIQHIRRHWRDACSLSKEEQLAVAYWRRGAPDA